MVLAASLSALADSQLELVDVHALDAAAALRWTATGAVHVEHTRGEARLGVLVRTWLPASAVGCELMATSLLARETVVVNGVRLSSQAQPVASAAHGQVVSLQVYVDDARSGGAVPVRLELSCTLAARVRPQIRARPRLRATHALTPLTTKRRNR